MVILKWFAGGVTALAVLAVIGLLIAQRVSDGPMAFVQGGPFTTGEVVEEKVTDWSFAVDREIEFELVGFGTSRIAGFIMLDGVAYMTCDLGFIWNRLEPGVGRTLLNLIYIFKDWHLDAVADGRARLRIDGETIYNTQFVKVEDPETIEALKVRIEALAAEYFGGEIGPRPAESPNDIWFFRMEPR